MGDEPRRLSRQAASTTTHQGPAQPWRLNTIYVNYLGIKHLSALYFVECTFRKTTIVFRMLNASSGLWVWMMNNINRVKSGRVGAQSTWLLSRWSVFHMRGYSWTSATTHRGDHRCTNACPASETLARHWYSGGSVEYLLCSRQSTVEYSYVKNSRQGAHTPLSATKLLHTNTRGSFQLARCPLLILTRWLFLQRNVNITSQHVFWSLI